MAYLYPYGDTQQLNLDWLIEQWNEVKSQIDGSLQAEIDRVEAAITDLLTARDEAVAAQTAAQASAQAAAGSSSTASGAASTATAQAQAAAGSAATAGAHASDAQGYAATAQQAAQAANNSASAAAVSEGNARNSETAAAGSSSAAAGSSSAAAGNALYAEGYAKGTQNGNPVSSGSPYYENNAKYWAEQAEIYGQQILVSKTIENVTVASFEDGANNTPVQELIVEVNPVQPGSGDPAPDNDRPITGWTETNIYQVKINQLPPNQVNTTYSSNGITIKAENGIYEISGTASATTNIQIPLAKSINLFPALNKICFLNTQSYNSMTVGFCRNNTQIHYWAMSNVNRVASGWANSGNENVDAIQITVQSGSTINCKISPVLMFTSETTVTTYIPYYGDVYNINFPDNAGTVFGATIDLVRSKLRVNRVAVDLGTLTFTLMSDTSSRQAWQHNFTDIKTQAANIAINALSSQFKPVSVNDTWLPGVMSFATDNSSFVVFCVNSGQYADHTDFETAMSGVQFVYELAIPIEYDLDDIPAIMTLLGMNNIWGDSGNIKLLTYYSNENINIPEKLRLIKAMLATVESDYTATQAYSVNDFLIVDNTLYIVTASIANGATITPGTNVAATTIGTQITSILNS